MDPKEKEILEIIATAKTCIQHKDYYIARNLLIQAEEIFHTCKAKVMLDIPVDAMGFHIAEKVCCEFSKEISLLSWTVLMK